MREGAVILEDLSQRIRMGYGEGLPSAADEQFIELAKGYIAAGPEGREQLRQAVPDDARLLLLGFSDRLATIAARREDRHYLLLAVVAHSIEDFRFDVRENILRMALVDHVAQRLGASMRELLSEVMSLSSTGGAQHFAEFLKRPAEINTLETMGLREVMTDEGVDYRWIG